MLSANKFRLTQQPSADRHFETYMVAKPVRETEDPRRVVELRERTRRQQSRSGDVPDYQEDQPREDQTQDQVHQDFAESVHRQSC